MTSHPSLLRLDCRLTPVVCIYSCPTTDATVGAEIYTLFSLRGPSGVPKAFVSGEGGKGCVKVRTSSGGPATDRCGDSPPCAPLPRG